MLKSASGVKDAGVNLANQKAWVDDEQEVTRPAQLQHVVQGIGYDLITDVEDPRQAQEEEQRRQYKELKFRTIWASALSVPIVIIGMFFMNMPYGKWISLVLAAPVVFWLGRSFFRNAFKQDRHGKAKMDKLVALSTGIAFLFSSFNMRSAE